MHANVWKLAFSKGESVRHRVIALYNLIGFSYFVGLLTLDTVTLLLVILPQIFSGAPLYTHIAISVYLSGTVGLSFYRSMTTTTETPKPNNPPSDRSSQVCEVCHLTQPIRSHHCWLCNVCIDKRDHHCFFMGTCIGQRNQKYFIVYCFYQFIAGLYFVIISALFLFKKFKFSFDMAKFVSLPFMIIFRTIMDPGSADLYFSYCVGLMYGTLVAMLVGICFFAWQMFIVSEGLTTREARTTGQAEGQTRSSTLSENFNDVFPGGTLKYFILPFSKERLLISNKTGNGKTFMLKKRGRPNNKRRH